VYSFDNEIIRLQANFDTVSQHSACAGNLAFEDNIGLITDKVNIALV
jgi:hypothetical protein